MDWFLHLQRYIEKPFTFNHVFKLSYWNIPDTRVTLVFQPREMRQFIVACGIGIGIYVVWKINNYLRPLRHMNVKVVTTEKECNRVVARLRKDLVKYPVLGFDCEWVTRGFYRGPVALLQLSSTSGFTSLIRLSELRYIPRDLRQLLEDERVLKVGVGSNNDADHLRYDYGVVVRGTADLSNMALGLLGKPGGLAKLSESYIGVKLDKDLNIIRSDWSIQKLSAKQIKYAAKDAFVAIEIFKKMSKIYEKKKMHKMVWMGYPKNFLQWARSYV